MSKPFRLVKLCFFSSQNNTNPPFGGKEEVAAEHVWGCVLINVSVCERHG